jgi:acyl-CoA thioester hydrolase
MNQKTAALPEEPLPAHGSVSDKSPADGHRIPGGPARITVQQQVQWADTDASGHHHFSAPTRWIEQTENLLYESLGIADVTSGCVPRVHFEIDYLNQLFFRDPIEVTLTVQSVGRTSVTYSFQITAKDILAVRGNYVVVLTARTGKKARPWPEAVRAALAEGGEQPRGSTAATKQLLAEDGPQVASNHRAERVSPDS